jgi:hypothetical protein
MVDFTFCVIANDATEENPTVNSNDLRKVKFYDDFFEYKCEYEFVPATIDTYGRMGSKLKAFLKMAARSAARNPAHYKQLVYRISQGVPRGHACQDYCGATD